MQDIFMSTCFPHQLLLHTQSAEHIAAQCKKRHSCLSDTPVADTLSAPQANQSKSAKNKLGLPPHHSLQTLIARGIVIGSCVGILIAAFRLSHATIHESIAHFFHEESYATIRIVAWIGIVIAIAFIVGRIIKRNAFISGSGIPNVELALAEKVPLPWERVLIDKFAGSWLCLAGGLSLGREGPSIQMGAVLGHGLDQLWGGFPYGQNPYVIAGSAAGLCTAFGAPLAGIIFVFEEMKCKIVWSTLVLSVVASYTAYIVMTYGFSIGIILPFQRFEHPPLTELIWLACLGLIMGLLGVLYNYTLLYGKKYYDAQRILPTTLKPLPPLLCAGILFYTYPIILGGGDSLMAHLDVTHYTTVALITLILSKFAFSQFSFICGVPGGLLMPLLCIGALIGSLFANAGVDLELLRAQTASSYLVFAMAGYFAAIVRAPLTGVLLVTEMSGTFSCLPGTLLVAFIANTVANGLNCPPVYDSLKERIVATRASSQ